jgi:hypothetical protein
MKMKTIVSVAMLSLAGFLPGLGAHATVVDDATLVSPSANPADPGFYNGLGNSSADFTVDTENGIEIGLAARTRGVAPNVIPIGNVYDFAAGGSGGNALWNFNFSVDLRPGAVGNLTLSQITTQLTVVDALTGATKTTETLGIPDNAGWGPAGKNVAIANLTTDWGAQNSENLGFAGFLPPGNSIPTRPTSTSSPTPSLTAPGRYWPRWSWTSMCQSRRHWR